MLSTAKPPLRFPALMIALHWTTAALIVAVVVIAWTWPHGHGPDRDFMLLLHRSLGLTILALTALRLVVRRLSARPDDGAGVSRLEVYAARLVHALLYVILFAMPLSGYLYTTARGNAVSVFGLFDLPALLPASETQRSVAWAIHGFGQYAVYVVVGLHVAAALYHLAVRRDGVMWRMLPWASRLIPRPRPAARPAAR